MNRFWRFVFLTFFCTLPTLAAQKDDLLQKAFNYVLTGDLDPKDAPEIIDPTSCVIVLRDPKYPRFIKYYFARITPDNSRITKDYAGRKTLYKLDIESANVVIEYLSADKATTVEAFKSAQIDLPGDIEETQKALKVISQRCKQERSSSPFS